MILMILLLACATFFDPGFVWFGGTVCMAMALVGCVWYSFHDHRRVRKIVREFDWGTAAFLMGVFVLVGMLDNRGVIAAVVEKLGALRGAHPFVLYSVVVWASVLLSGFIDNVPYVTAMLPVVIRFATEAGLPVELFAFGLLIGACLGGNITPIGASANVVAVGLLHREGHPISFGGFMKMGFPFTVAATAASYVVLWFVYR
jgi:Na+/H+ antiporter NhaD/arsenite permease-like protein